MEELIFTALMNIDYILVRLIAIGRAALAAALLAGLCAGAWLLVIRYKEEE